MKKKILLVDDKGDFRRLVRIILSQKFEVETADGPLNAFNLIKNGFVPDLIVSDLVMPEVDGRTFVKQLKTSGVFNKIPIIILSSIDKSSERINLIKSGVLDYMIKPFNPEELIIRIESVFNNRLVIN